MIKITTFFILLLAFAGAAKWRSAGRTNPNAYHSVTIAVKQNVDAAATCDTLLMEVSDPDSPKYGDHKSMDEANKITLDAAAVKRVESYLTKRNIMFVTTGDYIKVTDKVSVIENLLSTKFSRHMHPSIGRPVLKAGPITVPSEISNDVHFVMGVNLPKILSKKMKSTKLVDANGNCVPDTINKAYGIKNNTVTYASQSLFEAVGQEYSPSDLASFQSTYNIPNTPVERVTGPNDGDCSDPDNCLEANLDVQYIIAIAQSQNTSYRVIDASNPDPFWEWITELSQAPNAALVHSISYGSSFSESGESEYERWNTEVCKLGLRGITILVSSGDDGVAGQGARGDSSQCGFTPSFPATSPYILAVGATQGPEAGTAEIAETSDAGGLITTGGGFSVTFKRPAYQDSFVKNYLATAQNLPDKTHFAVGGRGYPDVAALGHNYIEITGGSQQIVSGTSASSPVFAAMLTLINDERIINGKKPVGFVNPAIYAAARSPASYAAIFNDITKGRNNCCAGDPGSQVCCDEGFTAAKGWDPLTGLGSPKFEALRKYFAGIAK